jgi:hypothetical protein
MVVTGESGENLVGHESRMQQAAVLLVPPRSQRTTGSISLYISHVM